jgi:GT2 family glycosyltransferase
MSESAAELAQERGSGPEASFIIVNWNGMALLRDCINSILQQTYENYEIIVVDNGSTDGSADYVEQHFPSVRSIRLAENRGFTGGNIEGLKHARGKYIGLVNNDVSLSKQWLHSMISEMGADPAVGICSSMILIHGTHRIDSIGNAFTTAGSGIKQGENEDIRTYPSPSHTWGACAAAVFYRKAMLDDIGFLDDMLFLNYEDTDLDFRALLAGWRSRYVPEAQAYHKISSTLGQFSERSVYYFARNSLLVWMKDMPLLLMLRYLHHRLLYEVSSFVYYGILKGRWRPFLRRKCSAFAVIPSVLRNRKLVQQRRRVTLGDLQSVMIPVHRDIIRRVKRISHSRGEG